MNTFEVYEILEKYVGDLSKFKLNSKYDKDGVLKEVKDKRLIESHHID